MTENISKREALRQLKIEFAVKQNVGHHDINSCMFVKIL